jgi:hypothetical protein
MPRDFFLRRHENFEVAFDDGLTRERETGGEIIHAQAHRRAASRVAAFDDDRAPTATPLTATRHVDLNARFARGIGNQRAVFDLDSLFSWFEVNCLGGDIRTQLSVNSKQ